MILAALLASQLCGAAIFRPHAAMSDSSLVQTVKPIVLHGTPAGYLYTTNKDSYWYGLMPFDQASEDERQAEAKVLNSLSNGKMSQSEAYDRYIRGGYYDPAAFSLKSPKQLTALGATFNECLYTFDGKWAIGTPAPSPSSHP